MTDPKTLAESGVLLVDKAKDWTSHDVVNCVRKRFNIKKVGHCGTLDPQATGLLILVTGRATKLSEQFMNHDKKYEGTLHLGIATTTQDAEGEVKEERSIDHLSRDMVENAVAEFRGEIEQIPPMASAVKKNGQKLYKLARKGVEVEREPKKVTVHDFTITNFNPPFADFALQCTKGTYVRTLCHDIGELLDCGGYLYKLRRTQSGVFSIADSYTTDTIKQWEREDLLQHLIPLDQVLSYI